MDAEQILAIPVGSPDRLFPNNKDEAKKLHRRLSSLWHADRNPHPDASRVLAHINVLYDKAVSMIDLRVWPSSTLTSKGKVRFTTSDDKTYELAYLKKRDLPIGVMYISKNVVTYVLRPEFSDLMDNMLSITKFKYKDSKLEAEHARNLPGVKTTLNLKDGSQLVMVSKSEEHYLLQDVLDAMGGALPPKAVAWIMSALYNIDCYLKIAGIAHNDISPLTVFINAKTHHVMLLGGWWYSSKVGVKPKALPRRTAEVVHDPCVKNDTTLIRMTGKDMSGSALMKAPPGIQRWLRGLGTDDSFREYQMWQQLLEAEFGPRRFEVLNLPIIYKD